MIQTWIGCGICGFVFLKPLSSIDISCRFFISHDREFHVASLNYKPDFKVMPEGWDGTIKDMDEVHYEISKKEDDMLYEEFVRKFEFNKMKVRPFFCPLGYALT